MKNEKGIWKYENMSTCKYEVIKQLLAENNEQENSGTFWWITKDISFHSNKIFFFTKRQVTLNFSEWTSNIHSFHDTNGSGPIVPWCETSKPNMAGLVNCEVLKKLANLTLRNGPGKRFSRTSNGLRTMSLLGGGIVWKLQKCTNQTRLDTKNSGWRKMPLIQE